MKKKINASVLVSLDEVASCVSGYDPDSLNVNDGKKIIKKYLESFRDELSSETVPIRESLGRVLFTDLISNINVPPNDNAAMDGYAFNSSVFEMKSEEIIELSVVKKIFAGDYKLEPITADECVNIMTGAPMPVGCDTVIPQEFVEKKNNTIRFLRHAVPPLANCRLKGEDLTLGKPALLKGKILNPADLGLIASQGFEKIEVYRKLKVAFFSTGDELVPVGQKIKDGKIYDSNSQTIFAMLTKIGVEIHDMGLIPDNFNLLEKAFKKAAEIADVTITSGGVSVGEADYTKMVVKKLGDVAFWKVSMRPGRPMVFGKIWTDEKKNSKDFSLLFGLPGNPVAVMVTFYVFVRDALIEMMGSSEIKSNLLYVASSEKIKKKPGRTEYRRGKINYCDGLRPKVSLTGSQGSGILSSMSQADCLVVLDDDTLTVEIGEYVPVLVFDGIM